MPTFPRKPLIVIALIGSYWVSGVVWADALVVTKAMTASTIAEIFVEEEFVRMNLEVGVPDLLAFRNILPDALLAKLGLDPSRLEDRLKVFFQKDLVVRADDGNPLPGRVVSLQSRRRVVRDEITGEPLAEQPADAEFVVVAELRYAMQARPAKLTIAPPTAQDEVRAPNIGFVAYHGGLPVNEFRYFASEVNLDLNWDDPWYSRFRNRNLARQFAAPLSAYLYVEPFEVRKEIIVRPRDLQRFIDLGLSQADVISIDQQAELKDRVGQFLSNNNRVLIDGQARQGFLDRIHFVRRTLRRTGIVDPPEDLSVTSATLGVIFVYPIDELPQEVTMEWELFDARIQEIPAAASDEAGPLPVTLTPQDPVLHWKNYLKNPTIPSFATIAPPPTPARISLPIVTLLCAAVMIPLGVLLVRSHRFAGRVSTGIVLTSVVLAVVGAVALPSVRLAVVNPFVSPRPLSDADATEILTGLIHNVYRSFDRRDQSLIYDQLSRSIAGDLLEQVYLETRKGIEIENQGGLQIKVDDVTMQDLQQLSVDKSRLTYRCRWQVSGSVGHWGHVHTRVNEPTAQITLAPTDGAWKIVAMTMNDEPLPEPRPSA